MYEAIVTPVVNIRPIKNSDRIVLGTAAGHQVIIGLDTVEDTMGIFIPSDMQLSLEMAAENNLHRHGTLNRDPKKTGFFDDNRRVRAQKFRGEISEGFWCPLSLLEWTGEDLTKLRHGQLIKELNGNLICNKYYTPATQKAMNASGGGKISRRTQLKRAYPTFLEHWNIPKLRMVISNIPKNSMITITCKVHGTSGRTGFLQEQQHINWLKKGWNYIFKQFGPKFEEYKYKYISGTRRVTLDPTITNEVGYYSGKQFRSKVHKMFVGNLHPGETIYYEMVGYDDSGGLIMPAHKIEDKKLKKVYGSHMVYKYGCEEKECKVLVYRITRTLPNGAVEDMSWNQVVNRCSQLGITTVPLLAGPFIYDGNTEVLTNLCEKLSQGNSVLDLGHIKEGVVIRCEAPGLVANYKYKSFWFADLEGIQKNDLSYVDPEDVA